MNELKLCPFCGGSAEFDNNGIYKPIYDTNGAEIDADIQEPTWYAILCKNCGAEIVSDESEVQVEKEWNNRTDNWIKIECFNYDTYPKNEEWVDVWDGEINRARIIFPEYPLVGEPYWNYKWDDNNGVITHWKSLLKPIGV